MASRTLAVAVALCLCVASVSAGPLWDYVHNNDDTFKWEYTGYTLRQNGTKGKAGWTGYLLNVTSQTWLTSEQVSLSVWHHQLMVFVPDNLDKTKTMGAIYNTDGNNPLPAKPPGLSDPEVALISELSVMTQTITSIIWQIPNQPLVFAADPTKQKRSEDAAVAFTWFEFITHPDNPEYIIELPMTKAVVKGMDAVTEFVVSKGVKLENFLVSGASKRGWTAWLVGCVDTRAAAIAPIVMDMLNFQKNVLHMYKAYGGWTFAFGDYYAMNITKYLDTPLLDPLAKIIDPLEYKDNLTMPKLVIDATGDEFFMPDDDHFWWGDLPGETYRLMVANADHSMATGLGPLFMGLSAFYQSLLIDAARPVLDWTIEPTTGNIVVTSNVEATKAVMRWATTEGKDDSDRRDFRLFKGDTKHDPCIDSIVVHVFGEACLQPVLWVGETLEAVKVNGGYQYTATQPMPPQGQYRGFFVDMYLPGPSDGFTFRFTTQVSIIPQSFPFPACSGDGCIGFLV